MTDNYNAQSYEKKYREGFGLVYPESHIIRTYKHILEWELKLTSGTVFDFGCGSGQHLKYFAEQSFTPFGCDTSQTAIQSCRDVLPKHADNFFVSAVNPDLKGFMKGRTIDVFLSNQVLYFLDNKGIRDVVEQAYSLVRKGGVFIASMMDYSCWYARFVTSSEGDFKRCELKTPRLTDKVLINFKRREELEPLFKPFRKLHIGMYTNHIREDEGPTAHWLFTGIKD